MLRIRGLGRLGRTPRIVMAKDALSGSFDAPSVSRSVAGSFGLAQDDRGSGDLARLNRSDNAAAGAVDAPAMKTPSRPFPHLPTGIDLFYYNCYNIPLP